MHVYIRASMCACVFSPCAVCSSVRLHVWTYTNIHTYTWRDGQWDRMQHGALYLVVFSPHRLSRAALRGKPNADSISAQFSVFLKYSLLDGAEKTRQRNLRDCNCAQPLPLAMCTGCEYGTREHLRPELYQEYNVECCLQKCCREPLQQRLLQRGA